MTRNIFGAGAFFGLLVMVAIQLLAGNMPYLNIAAATGVALLVGTYLGLDLMVAVSKTLELPKGKFKRIEVSKYICFNCCSCVHDLDSDNFQDVHG